MTVDVESRPLVVTADRDLRAELDRVCAAVGVAADHVRDLDEARAGWRTAAAVLVGPDAVDPSVPTPGPRRPGVVLTTWQDDSAAVWRAAVAVHAEGVLVLPDQRAGLSALLTELTEGSVSGTTVGVIGSRGGIGASTVAVALARAAAAGSAGPASPASVVLVDGDPDGGGIDLLMGCEATSGLRWPDLARVRGRVGAAALRSALPACGGVAVLSWTPDPGQGLPAGTTASLVASAGRGADLVVVDLPRHPDAEAATVVGELDAVLLVVGPDVRSVAGAARLAARLEVVGAGVAVVAVGGPADRVRIAAALGVPVAATVAWTRRTERSIADGLGPEMRRRDTRSLRRYADTLLSGRHG